MKKQMLFSKKGQKGAVIIELLIALTVIIVSVLIAKGVYDAESINQLPEYQNLRALIKQAKADPNSVTDEQLEDALDDFRGAISDDFGGSMGERLAEEAQESLDKIRDQQFVIKISVNPADPAPFERVFVTVTVLKASEGTPVSYSVHGTDGYTQNGTLSTDINGQISFSIPGGAKGVVDVITIAAGSVTEEFAYTF